MNSYSSPPHNLPLQSTSFIGRAPEIKKIVELIDDPACRLITLIGPGGIGKTRLALEVANQIVIRENLYSGIIFSNGVYFIELQPVNSPELVVSTIAESLGFSFHGQEDPKAQLLDYLHERQLLLVLDNFEHLLEGTGLMSEILQAAPTVQVMVTSREALNLQEEWVRKVRGMRFPDNDMVEEIEAYSAMKLFIERARQVRGEFSPEKEHACVIRVCQLVGGMPLAIELAVAWLKRLPCAEVANEIERNLDFLTTRLRNVPERHRSIRAVFEHSWNLLEKGERDVFKQLAVFRGGFRREASEAVADASLFTLSSLVDKSMLRMAPTGRYEIHELLRQYAEEKLDEIPGAKDAAHDRHCDYYADYLYQRQENSRNAYQVEFMEEIGADIENARAAWDWAITHEKWEAIGKSLDSLERFCTEMCWYLQVESAFCKAVAALRTADSSGAYDLILGRLIARHGYIRVIIGQKGEARDLAQESLVILDPFQSHRDIVIAYLTLAYADWGSGESEHYQKGLAVARGSGDIEGTAMLLAAWGWETLAFGQYKEARGLLHQSLTLFRQIGERWGIAWMLGLLSVVACLQGRYEEARQLAEESLATAQESNSRQVSLVSLPALGDANYALGAFDEARQAYQECLNQITMSGMRGLPRQEKPTFALGNIAHIFGDDAIAKELFKENLTLGRQFNQAGIIASAHCGLGRVAYSGGDYVEANQQLQESLKLYKETSWQLETISVIIDLGMVATALGKEDDARKFFYEALQSGSKLDVNPTMLETVVGISELLTTQDNLERAVELLALALNHPACHAYTKVSATRLLNQLETKLSSEIYTAALERGKANNLDAIAVALLNEFSGSQTGGEQVSSRAIKQPLVDPLSERELEVLALIAKGLSNREIAEKLYLTVGTVKVHASNIYSKLDVGKRIEAVARARELGLL